METCYTHGGEVYSYMESHGGSMPIDLSASINPYGIPPSVMKAMQEALELCTLYPDPFCRAVRRAIADRENISPEWIYCGAGAADVLDRLANVVRPRNVYIPIPAFEEYERTLKGAQMSFHELRREEGFALKCEFLNGIKPETQAVYICNPNNPTARAAEPELMEGIVRRCAQKNVWLIVDECFIDFLNHAEIHTLKGYLRDNPRLAILRSYTKMYAVPGVRFGFCMSSNLRLINALYGAGQPWNVSVIAQKCAEAAAREADFASWSAKRLAHERACLEHELVKRGNEVFPGEANFMLLRSQKRDLPERLREHGVLIRDCGSFRGLEKGYCRVSVKTRAESNALLDALDAVAAATV